METTKDGNAPATKEDIRQLELTMLAGFEMCAYLSYCAILGNAQGGIELPEELQNVARAKAKQRTRPMIESLRQRILNEHGNFINP